jgi:hypothetical protein
MIDRDAFFGNMSNFSVSTDNEDNASWYDGNDGPPLHTRLAFASAWIFIAVAGILGKWSSSTRHPLSNPVSSLQTRQ